MQQERKFKLGDKVFDIRRGWGEVVDIEEIKFTNPLIVKFDNYENIERYTYNGKLALNDLAPSLSHEDSSCNSEIPKMVEVSHDGKNWVKRILIAIRNNKAICWERITYQDKTEEVVCKTWFYYREVKEEEEVIELTLKDISEGKGVGVPSHLIRIKE